MGVLDRLSHAWNTFKADSSRVDYINTGLKYTHVSQPMRRNSYIANDRSIINTILTRMAIDVSTIEFVHAKLDDNKRYTGEVKSGLNYCFNVEANVDQSARAFKQDLVMTLFEKGVAAVVPVDTDLDPTQTGGYDIKTMRVGEVVGWFPKHVKLNVYNDNTGQRQEIFMDKKHVAIVQNPLYAIMNEPNSTLQRLISKLRMLDELDESAVSNKLDMIIQLPYVIKSEARKTQADQRRKDIEFQLSQGKYGIAYTDGTEKITQLNRPIENNMLETVEYMTAQLYSQLGLTQAVLEGSAGEDVMLNYFKRTIEPIADTIAEELARTFLTKTARAQSQSVIYLRRPFELVPMTNLAEIADKFVRNEILTSNEIRSMVGFKPVDDPRADELRNSNMPRSDTEVDVRERPVIPPGPKSVKMERET